MNTRGFTVETSQESVLIFGGSPGLNKSLIDTFSARGLAAGCITQLAELLEFQKFHDPDYLLVFPGGLSGELIPALQKLLDSGQSQLVELCYRGVAGEGVPLSPISKTIEISDYVGETELHSPLIESWIISIKSQKSLVIPGEGVGEYSLLGLTDLSNLVALATLIGSSSRGARIELANPSPISPLNLAYLLRTCSPSKISLSFDDGSLVTFPPYNAESYSTVIDRLGYSLIANPEEILRIYLSDKLTRATTVPVSVDPPKVEAQKVLAVPPLTTEKPKKLTVLNSPRPVFIPLEPRRLRKPLSLNLHFKKRERYVGPPKLKHIVGRGLLIAVALYIGTLAFSLTISSLSLKNSLKTLGEGSIPTPSHLDSFALTYLRANWVALTSFPGLNTNASLRQFSLLLDSYDQALSAFSSNSKLSSATSDLTSYTFGTKTLGAAETISLARLQAEELYQKLSLLDGTLPSDVPSIIPTKYQDLYRQQKSKLTELKRGVTTTKAVLSALPDVIGLGSRRKYAVLFQNSLELRATGGFIGSFAIVTLENGKLYDMPIFDVYEVDGQLKGHVEPPRPIKDILGESNWYLRDSNFDPDFPTTARRVEWFIKKAMNIDLNGTIALNLNSLQNLLTGVGPVTVPDYNESVSGSTIAERTQFHAEGNFFPGSTQKKEFLSTVGSSIFGRLPSLSSAEQGRLVSSLVDSIQSKNTLFAFLTPTVSRVFDTLGWSGSVSDLPCPATTGCQKDYLMIVDSNFGVNKANYYVKRSIDENIKINQDFSVSHTLRLSYQNTAVSTAWPAGLYKNYQRLYLPPATTIDSLTVGSQSLSTKNYTITQEHGKLVLSYLLTVPVDSQLSVELGYTLAPPTSTSDLLYSWYWQKQPGTSDEDPLGISLSYPPSLKPAIISPASQLDNGQLQFTQQNDTDHRITVKFTK